MGYSLSYGCDTDRTQHGPCLASGGGWNAWSEWALSFDGLEECHTLAEHGYSAELETLAEELEQLQDATGPDELKAIAKTLADAVAARPEWATAIGIDTGTQPSGEDDGDDSEEEV